MPAEQVEPRFHTRSESRRLKGQLSGRVGLIMDLKEFFLTQKESEHQGTLAVYEKIPRDRLDWRPVEGMLSLGQLARHVWRSEEGTRRMALESDWTYYETRIPQGLFTFLGAVTSLDDEL